MEDESEYANLPTEEMCVHKLWKARVTGYEKAAKLFKQIDDDKSQEWYKYLGLIKKFVVDSNAVAQEKGLEAALAFIENCSFAGKTVGEVMSGIVTKCIAAPKTKTKDLALQVTLMCVEIEKHDATLEELIKGMEHKNPRIAAACITAITTALRQFGNKVISIKLLVKKIPTILTDRDKDVRTEGKALVVEMHRWIGPALEPHISQLQAVVLQELRDAFNEHGKAVPERYLRSQQIRTSIREDNVDGGNENNEEPEEDENAPDVDPYELMDPVDILSKLPKDFYDKLEAKKWQERKEALDALEGLLKAAPKLEQGEYGDLVRALKKVISKDSNVLLVALSGRCIFLLASGLKKRFQTYTSALVPCILEKFKEKKTNVVSALREAIDAIYLCTNIEAISEDVIEALNNKNPQVKAETTAFLTRAISRTQPASLTKKLLKVYVPALLKVLESADPIVRDQAAEALGMATKLVGEKNISPFIGKLDNLKEQKIQECCEKAVILVKVAGPKKEVRPKTAPEPKPAPKAGSAQPKAVKRPVTGVKKADPKKIVTESAKAVEKSDAYQEREICSEDVDMKAEELMGPAFINDITDQNWKVRLEAVQTFSDNISTWGSGDVGAQILLKIINKKPGLKDNNIQALKIRLEVVKTIATSFPISTISVDSVLYDVVEKLSDPKTSPVAGEVLTALSEANSLDYVVTQSLEYAMDKQKSPRVQTEIFEWLNNALLEFGMVFNVKSVLIYVKKALAATNPAIRTGAMTFLSTLYRYTGASLYNMLDAAKIVIKPQMKQEIEKFADSKPPASIRGVKKSSSRSSLGDDAGSNAEDLGEEETTAPAQDTRARVDICPLITEALIAEINDKNWKVRNEALDKVKSIISNAQLIKPTIGELPQALAHRLVDSNSKIGQLTLQICEQMVVAMGPKAKTHIRTLFPGFFQGLGDSKNWIKSASLQCINEWVNQCGVPSIFDGEIVFDALKTGGPILRAELWMWLSEKLPAVPPKSIPREELAICIPLLYAALEDRGAEVRRGAGEAVLGFMMHLGSESMTRQAEKLKPGSKAVVQAALDKARPNMPIQPLPKAPEKGKSAGSAKVQGGAPQKQVASKSTKGITKSASTTNARLKKEEDTESTMPLLSINNTKHQRIIDDQKLKVLKWNFVTPREEFFDLLKDQMAVAGVNKSLISNMFHSDFRYHIKSLEMLFEDLPENGHALICNLDLIFKWLTLRFFDTNPSVLLKGLDYLSAVFGYLISENYQLAEYEAQCFIPYLVLKVGDPKDSVRNGVKLLLKQICTIYSASKLFGYLMEGLKSKNARQRTECLDVLGLLIESFGVSICNPSPTAALKEVAKQISDRDNSVRNAALNCIVQAYYLEGEKVYKMIGQITDKDYSLLEERIKRAAKTKDTNRKTMLFQTATVRPTQHEIKDVKPPINDVDQNLNEYDDDEEEIINDYPPPTMRLPQQTERVMPVVRGQFGLDPNILAAIEAENLLVEKPHIQEVDLAFLDEPSAMPSANQGSHALACARPLSTLNPLSPPSRLTLQPVQSNAITSLSQPDITTLRYEQDNVFTKVIQSISSPTLNVAINALSQMECALRSNRTMFMTPYEEQFVLAMVEQFKNLERTHLNLEKQELCSAYSYLISVLNLFYEVKNTGKNVSSASIGALIDQLLRLLVSRVLENHCDDNLVRAVNSVCVKVLDRSEYTALICSLLTLLQNSVAADPPSPRYQELEMKCLWKVMKMLPNWECDAINYDQVLYKIYNFFQAYPNSYWKRTPRINDTPHRTMKTLLNTLIKKKGSNILNHVTLIPDFQDSELHHYILKLFKALKIDENAKENVNMNLSMNMNFNMNMNMPANDASPIKMPRLVQEELSQILRRIAEKQHSREALRQLYDLRERNPTVDIWVCLKDASNLFRKYIERGLQEVADERRNAGIAPISVPSITLTSMPILANISTNDTGVESSKGHMHHLERLRALQAKASIVSDSSSDSQPRTPIIDNRTLADPIEDNVKRSIDPKFDLPSLHQQPSQREPQMEMLKQKLQKIKSANR